MENKYLEKIASSIVVNGMELTRAGIAKQIRRQRIISGVAGATGGILGAAAARAWKRKHERKESEGNS